MSDEIVDAGRAQWLEERATGIGGSDVAAILGLSPYASPLDVWLEKTNRGTPVPRVETAPMWWGSALEDVVARRYHEDTGAALWAPGNRVMRHPDLPYFIGTPDRLVIGAELGLEVKTASHHTADRWGEPGTDEVPEEYLLQCAHYMAITGYPRWDIAVLMGGSDFRIYRLRRDRELEDAVIARLREWWARHVEAGERPEIDGSEATAKWLARQFPRHIAPPAVAPPEAEPLAAQLAHARNAIDQWEEQKRAAENGIKALLEDRAGFQAASWRVSWRQTKPKSETNWEAVARMALKHWDMMAEHVQGGREASLISQVIAPDREFEDIVKANTTETPGVRRFLFKDGG